MCPNKGKARLKEHDRRSRQRNHDVLCNFCFETAGMFIFFHSCVVLNAQNRRNKWENEG